MIVATLAILATQSRHPASARDLVAILDGKPYRISRLSSDLSRLLARSKEPFIPNTWSAMRTPYIPNTYHVGDVDRFPLPGAHEAMPLTAKSPPQLRLEGPSAADASMKRLLKSLREAKKQR